MAETLKPCPLCGGPAERVGAAIRCAPCGVQVSPRWDELPRKYSAEQRYAAGMAESASRWNRRAEATSSTENSDALLAKVHAYLVDTLEDWITGPALHENVCGEWIPYAFDPDCGVDLQDIADLLAVIRELETLMGGVAEREGPQWLSDVIEGRLNLWEADQDGDPA